MELSDQIRRTPAQKINWPSPPPTLKHHRLKMRLSPFITWMGNRPKYVFHKDVISALGEFRDFPFQAEPVILLNKANELLSNDYVIFHHLLELNAIDSSRSELRDGFASDGSRYVSHIKKLKLQPEIVSMDYPILQIEGLRGRLFFSDKFLARLHQIYKGKKNWENVNLYSAEKDDLLI